MVYPMALYGMFGDSKSFIFKKQTLIIVCSKNMWSSQLFVPLRSKCRLWLAKSAAMLQEEGYCISVHLHVRLQPMNEKPTNERLSIKEKQLKLAVDL